MKALKIYCYILTVVTILTIIGISIAGIAVIVKTSNPYIMAMSIVALPFGLGLGIMSLGLSEEDF